MNFKYEIGQDVFFFDLPMIIIGRIERQQGQVYEASYLNDGQPKIGTFYECELTSEKQNGFGFTRPKSE